MFPIHFPRTIPRCFRVFPSHFPITFISGVMPAFTSLRGSAVAWGSFFGGFLDLGPYCSSSAERSRGQGGLSWLRIGFEFVWDWLGLAESLEK